MLLQSHYEFFLQKVTKSGQNSTKNHQIHLRYTSFSGSGTLGDEILYGVVRKKFLELAVELCRQRFVMSNDQRRFIQLLADVCHHKGFSKTSDTQKGLALVAFFETSDKVGNRLGLVAGGVVF